MARRGGQPHGRALRGRVAHAGPAAAAVLVRFDEPLDSPSMRFLQWDRYGYVPFALPAVGESVVLPKIDMEAALKGP